MTRHLCISVTLLDPLFHGKGDRDEPEWPPSPMRLFQALIAGSRAGCRNGDWSETKAEAYRWLERSDPPVIIAPASQHASSYTLFVPRNDADKKFERQDRLNPKIVSPYRIKTTTCVRQPDQQLHYLWAIPETEWPKARRHVEVLCQEARYLTVLGWGIDQAVAHGLILTDAQVQSLSGQQWCAWNAPFAGRPQLRVPNRGTLDDLDRAYKAFINRLSMEQPPRAREPRVFRSAVYLPASMLPPRPYAVFELPDGIAFRQEQTIAVAAILRSTVCDDKRYRNRQDFQEQFPDDDPEVYLAGHAGNSTTTTPPRFSYLPLPTIGHEHADGMIRRVLIAEPFGGAGLHAKWAQQRLRGQILRDHNGNERGALDELRRSTSKKMLGRYGGWPEGAKQWASITPVVLPGFDDGKIDKRNALALRAIRHAGLPVEAVESLVLREAPYWPGSHHPQRYRRPDYLKHYPAWHFYVRFREPLFGPIAIGAGRHCGLGLFAAVE